MVVFGYTKDYKYSGDGTLMIRVRIPAVHGPMFPSDARGQVIRNYVRDSELPYYPSLLLPHLPADGEVVALTSMNEKSTDFLVIGLTGGSYYTNLTGR